MALTMSVLVNGRVEQRTFTVRHTRFKRSSGGIPGSGDPEQVPDTSPDETVVFFFGAMPRIYKAERMPACFR